eukprot:4271654-Amphidinium_carterae.1
MSCLHVNTAWLSDESICVLMSSTLSKPFQSTKPLTLNATSVEATPLECELMKSARNHKPIVHLIVEGLLRCYFNEFKRLGSAIICGKESAARMECFSATVDSADAHNRSRKNTEGYSFREFSMV